MFSKLKIFESPDFVLYQKVGLYDFRDAENADRIAESSHKNFIYSLTRNVMEVVKVC